MQAVEAWRRQSVAGSGSMMQAVEAWRRHGTGSLWRHDAGSGGMAQEACGDIAEVKYQWH